MNDISQTNVETEKDKAWCSRLKTCSLKKIKNFNMKSRSMLSRRCDYLQILIMLSMLHQIGITFILENLGFLSKFRTQELQLVWRGGHSVSPDSSEHHSPR